MGDDRLLLIAQSDRSPKGKIFRLDVDGTPNATSSTPSAARDLGLVLRNPWRFDIDPIGGAIFIGEVGDYLWEEVNLASAGRARLQLRCRA